MCQIDRAILCVGPHILVVKNVQVVARHTPHHLGPVGVDLGLEVVHQVTHKIARQTGAAGAVFIAAPIDQGAIGEPGLGAGHVVHHVAIGNRAAAAGVVAGHAAQGGLRAGGHIHRIPQTVLFQGGVQVVQHHARLDFHRAVLDIERQDVAHMLAVVNDQARAHRLAALAGAAAARHDGHAEVAAQVQRGGHFVHRLRYKNTDRHLLVNRGVCGVAAAVGGAEQHFALGVLTQTGSQPAGHFLADAGHRVIDFAGGFKLQIAGQGCVHAVQTCEASGAVSRNCATTTSHLCCRCC